MVRNFLAWMAWHAATRAMTSFTFYEDTCKPKGIGLLETFKNPTYWKIILITAALIRSLKLKTKRTEVQICAVMNTNIE